MDNYLNNLKKTDLRPKKIKLEQRKESVLLEETSEDIEKKISTNNTFPVDEMEQRGIVDLHEEIIKWFMKNQNPPDSDVHALAEKMGIEHDKFEGHIYMILSDLIHQGRSKDFKGKYDPKELAMGIDVEKEHLPYPSIAEKIAKDHLAEIPDYYTRLKKMEAEGGVKESVQELFVQTGEIQGMDKGLQRDLKILRIGMIAELDAVNLYDELSNLAADGNVSKLMLDISHEEKVHAGEFETLLEEMDPSYEKAEEEGEEEVEDLLGI